MRRGVSSLGGQLLDSDVVDTGVAATTGIVEFAATRRLPISLSGLSQQSLSGWPVFLHRGQTTRLVFSARSVAGIKSGSLGSLLSASLADFLAWISVDLGSPTVATCKYFNKPARKLLSRKLSAGKTSN